MAAGRSVPKPNGAIIAGCHQRSVRAWHNAADVVCMRISDGCDLCPLGPTPYADSDAAGSCQSIAIGGHRQQNAAGRINLSLGLAGHGIEKVNYTRRRLVTRATESRKCFAVRREKYGTAQTHVLIGQSEMQRQLPCFYIPNMDRVLQVFATSGQLLAVGRERKITAARLLSLDRKLARFLSALPLPH